MTRNAGGVLVALAVTASLVAAAAFGAGCGASSSGVATSVDSGVQDATATNDGQTSTSDAGGDARLEGGLIAIGPVSFPPDFPAHFSTLVPPLAVADLTDLCAVETGSDTVPPSISLCIGTAPPAASMPPNIAIDDAHNTMILWVSSLHITHDVKVSGSRALAILSVGDIILEGPLDVSAVGNVAGPGALATGIGLGASGNANGDPLANAGGGGGGFGDDGGNGGNVSSIDAGANGGTLYGADAAAFVGGSSGGNGSVANSAGGGGGAIQLSAATSLIMLPTGAVRASGGGGKGGGGAGAGGGAGGLIYLESLGGFFVSGTMTANGGSGGAGLGANGSDGLASTTPAQGGAALDGGANGGRGGAVVMPATAGETVIGSTSAAGGGGGGAVGRLWFRMKQAPVGTPTFSPPPTILSF